MEDDGVSAEEGHSMAAGGAGCRADGGKLGGKAARAVLKLVLIKGLAWLAMRWHLG